MDFINERETMIAAQIIRRGITDQRVIDAMRRVPRHRFVPSDLVQEAYLDGPLPIGEGQTISQPYMVALMTEHLALKGDESVLEIGTGSGYQTAILAELSRTVYTIERIDALSAPAQNILHDLSYENIHFFIGNSLECLPDAVRMFDAIIVTAAFRERPEQLFEKLSPTGRMVAPVGGPLGQSLIKYWKEGAFVIEEEVCKCVFVPVIGTHGLKEPSL